MTTCYAPSPLLVQVETEQFSFSWAVEGLLQGHEVPIELTLLRYLATVADYPLMTACLSSVHVGTWTMCL